MECQGFGIGRNMTGIGIGIGIEIEIEIEIETDVENVIEIGTRCGWGMMRARCSKGFRSIEPGCRSNRYRLTISANMNPGNSLNSSSRMVMVVVEVGPLRGLRGPMPSGSSWSRLAPQRNGIDALVHRAARCVCALFFLLAATKVPRSCLLDLTRACSDACLLPNVRLQCSTV